MSGFGSGCWLFLRGDRAHCPVLGLAVAKGAEHESDVPDVVEAGSGAALPRKGIEWQCKAESRVILSEEGQRIKGWESLNTLHVTHQ